MRGSRARPGPPAPAGARLRTGWALPAAFGVAITALVVSLAFSGAAENDALGPGSVAWALPIVTTVHHLMMILVIGSLVMAGFVLPPITGPPGTGLPVGAPSGSRPRQRNPAYRRVLRTASVAAVIWACSATSVLVLTYLNLSGGALSVDALFTGDLWTVMAGVTIGRAWLSITLIAVVVSALAFAVRAPAAAGATALLALTSVLPISLTGHAAASDDRVAALGAIALHWVGVLLWVGGVAALALIAPVLSRAEASPGDGYARPCLQRTVLQRFSTLAGVAFCLVLVSGVISAALHLGGWEAVTSRYGLLIVVKAAATAVLGLIGLTHRCWAISRVGRGPAGRTAWRLIAAEVLIMAGVIGVAVALGRTHPPEPL